MPALPKAWREGGEVRGLRAEGGFEVDLLWSGEDYVMTIRSMAGQTCRVMTDEGLSVFDTEAGGSYVMPSDEMALMGCVGQDEMGDRPGRVAGHTKMSKAEFLKNYDLLGRRRRK